MDRHSGIIGRIVFGLGAALLSGPALAVTVSQTPLFVSTSVKPNVMLQFDNSGSMASIIWHEDYDPNTNYSGPFESDYVELGSDNRVTWNCFLIFCRELYLPGPSYTRYDGNYLNWLIQQYGEGSDLRNGQIPSQTRIEVARQVARQIVRENDDINFGLARFNAPTYNNSGPGGRIVAGCGASESAVLNAIDDLGPDTNTPLAETYYEITRYFRGLSRLYGGSGSYTSPIRYRCQRNFVIVITDGLPTYDSPDPGSDPDEPGPDGERLPDWDGKSPPTGNPPYPQYSDGEGGHISNEGSTLYLDDLAKFGYDIDLKKSGTDTTGGSYEDQVFDPQRLETYTVGFTIDNQMLEDAAGYGNGRYFTAKNLEELTTALQGALSSIADKTSTAAALAATSTQASSSTRVFRATFNSGTWSGDLSAYQFGADTSLNNPEWSASGNLPNSGNRDIYTLNGSRTGVSFSWDTIGSSGQNAIGGRAVLEYIRGSNAQTESQGGNFRNRDGLIGDIVNSTPAFVGDQTYGYSILPHPEGSSYRSYIDGKSSKPDIVLVGANDGMLHAFNNSDGSERFAYVPRQLFGQLSTLTNPDYSHRYYVDGSPEVADAYFGGAWHTVAVTTLGRGGKGAFALDVSDPANFNAPEDVLWEIDPGNVSGSGSDPGQYLGEVMGRAPVVRLESGHWVALLANGYNSQNGTAALLVVDLASGNVLKVLNTGAGNDNGLSTPAAIDRDRNGSVDTVYAGDLSGNLWKFDLSGDSVAEWDVAYGNPLVTARTNRASDGIRQPITARPDAITHPRGGVMVVFGTGRYLSTGDTQSTAEQSVYGVWDLEGARADDGTSITDARITNPGGELVEQEVEVSTSVGGRAVRVLSRKSVDYSDPAQGASRKRGWVFDLSLNGERITQDVRIFDGKAVMVSSIPEADPCSYGGDSALIEINPLTGTQFDQPVFDFDEDGDFDSDDGITVNLDGSSTRVYPGIANMSVGLATNPYILNQQSGDQNKLITGSNLNTETMGEKGFLRPGRASWLQLR